MNHSSEENEDIVSTMTLDLQNNSEVVDDSSCLPQLKTIAFIPCYNEERTIGSVVLKTLKYVDEVVVVDDGSNDDSVHIAELAGATVVRHDKNKGYGGAIQSCFSYAKTQDYDCMVILDGDGQHDPDDLVSVMSPVLEGKTDIAIGSRFLSEENRQSVPRYRQFGINVLTMMTNLFSGNGKDGVKLTDGQSGFRAYSRNAIAHISPKDANMGVSAEILLQARKHHLGLGEVPISVSYEGDTSNEGPVRHGLGVLVSILQYLEVEHSLMVFGLPGFLMVVAGVVFGLLAYLSYKQVGYFPFAQSALAGLLFITGILMGMTGLILHAVINANRRR